MASKAALKKEYDAGQAAQRYAWDADACPIEEGEERDEWLRGYDDHLAEKWLMPGRAHRVDLEG